MKIFLNLWLISMLLSPFSSYGQTNCPPPSIGGKLIYKNIYSTPVPSSIVFLKPMTGTILDSSLTDQYGNFNFCNVGYGSYILTAKSNFQWGGVNSADALIALKNFTDLNSLDQLESTAGDVNVNSYINSTDAFLISKRAIGLISSFPAGDWVFEEYQVNVNDTTSQNIIMKGLCSGDLNNSYVPFIQSFVSCGDTLIDQRDYQKYPTILIGSQCWMKKNLNIGTMVISTSTSSNHSNCSNNGIIEKYCYNNDPAMCAIYGGWYDWYEMRQYDTTSGFVGICPVGWHVPNNQEWCTLETFIDPTVKCNIVGGYTGINGGGKMKEPGLSHWVSPNYGATNLSGFTALGSGARTPTGGFSSLNIFANFWLSSNVSSTEGSMGGVVNTNASVGRGTTLKERGYTIRCLKD